MFLCLKHEVAQMLAQGGGGAIVNTASIAGLIGLATSAHYVAAKHGVVGLTKSAAIEYAQDGIRVNCVNPGYVATPMTKETIEERGEEILAKVPMRRMGVPGEIAEAVAWMCSDKASFMTGASHVIDPKIAPISTAVGVLGMPGMTAYTGLLNIGKPKAGETLVVAAAGAGRFAVGQIGRIKGAMRRYCRRQRQVRLRQQELGFEWPDHRDPDLAAKLKDAPRYRYLFRECRWRGLGGGVPAAQ